MQKYIFPYFPSIQTRGLKEPWVAHLRKRSKVTVETIIENPRAIIWPTLVEYLLMMYCYILNMKALGLVVSDKIFKCFTWPRDLLMQPTRTVWTTFIGDHPGIIPVKFGQIPISGSREDVVWSFPYTMYTSMLNCDPWGGVNFDPRGKIWTTLIADL